MIYRLTAAGAAIVAIALALTGCFPTPPVPTTEPSPSSTGSATPEAAEPVASASPSADFDPTTEALVLPSCADLYTADQVTALMGEFMALNPPGGDGGGSRFPNLRSLLDAEGTLNCTWVLPASERGLTVSVRAADTESDGAVRATLMAAGSAGTSTGGDSIIFAVAADETPDFIPYSEAHYLAGGVWVAVFDGFGSNAPALSQAAMNRVAELNPSRFR